MEPFRVTYEEAKNPKNREFLVPSHYVVTATGEVTSQLCASDLAILTVTGDTPQLAAILKCKAGVNGHGCFMIWNVEFQPDLVKSTTSPLK